MAAKTEKDIEGLLKYLLNFVLDYRDAARKKGRFDISDEIRDKLRSFGVKIEDDKHDGNH